MGEDYICLFNGIGKSMYTTIATKLLVDFFCLFSGTAFILSCLLFLDNCSQTNG